MTTNFLFLGAHAGETSKKVFCLPFTMRPQCFFYYFSFLFSSTSSSSVDCNITNLLYFSVFVYFGSFFVSYTKMPFSLIFWLCGVEFGKFITCFQCYNNIPGVRERVYLNLTLRWDYFSLWTSYHTRTNIPNAF